MEQVMDIEKVNEFNFLNGEVEEFRAVGVNAWLLQEALVNRSKKPSILLVRHNQIIS